MATGGRAGTYQPGSTPLRNQSHKSEWAVAVSRIDEADLEYYHMEEHEAHSLDARLAFMYGRHWLNTGNHHYLRGPTRRPRTIPYHIQPTFNDKFLVMMMREYDLWTFQYRHLSPAYKDLMREAPQRYHPHNALYIPGEATST